MQYMLMIYGGDELRGRLSREEAGRLADARDRWLQELVRSGHSRGTAGLHPASTATTLRERSGRLEITDGAASEAAGALDEYHLVECRDLDEAIAIASRYPALRAGLAMEIRPVMPQ